MKWNVTWICAQFFLVCFRTESERRPLVQQFVALLWTIDSRCCWNTRVVYYRAKSQEENIKRGILLPGVSLGFWNGVLEPKVYRGPPVLEFTLSGEYVPGAVWWSDAGQGRQIVHTMNYEFLTMHKSVDG